jgi:reactive intermediate/imine deaminase
MRRRAGQTDLAPPPAGAYSQSVRIGALVHAAGQGGHDPATGELAPDVATQTRQCLRNLEAVLAASGATLGDVIRCGVFLVDGDDFAAMNAVFEEIFEAPYPARTTVFVGLAGGMRVEIDALAVVDDG